MRAFDHREMVRAAIEAEYPALEMHSSGAGCGGWDLGFYVVGQPQGDRRSLELRGSEGGIVRAEIVRNYRRCAAGEPYEITRWPAVAVEGDAPLPSALRAACDAMAAA